MEVEIDIRVSKRNRGEKKMEEKEDCEVRKRC